MNWLNRAEAKYGHLAIHGLPNIIVAFNALVYILYLVNHGFLNYLTLDPDLVRQGQVWRLVTYLFIPQFGPGPLELISVIFYLMFIAFVGAGLERAMGAFKLNAYYLLGMIGVTVTSFIFGPDYASGTLNSTFLLAFARYYPDLVIYVFYILPMKIKWLAWLTAAGMILTFVTSGWAARASILICLANYIAFFGMEHFRDARHRSQVADRRARFDREVQEGTPATLHECTICKKTENSDPYLDFRVARDGQEYCAEHLPKADSEVVK